MSTLPISFLKKSSSKNDSRKMSQNYSNTINLNIPFSNEKIILKKKDLIDLIKSKPSQNKKFLNKKNYSSIPLLDSMQRFLSVEAVRQAKTNKYDLIYKNKKQNQANKPHFLVANGFISSHIKNQKINPETEFLMTQSYVLNQNQRNNKNLSRTEASYAHRQNQSKLRSLKKRQSNLSLFNFKDNKNSSSGYHLNVNRNSIQIKGKSMLGQHKLSYTTQMYPLGKSSLNEQMRKYSFNNSSYSNIRKLKTALTIIQN